MVKRILAAVIAGILLMSLFAACGADTAGNPAASAATVKADVTKASGKINIITQWAWTDEVLKAFKDKTGIEVIQDIILNPDNFKTARNSKLASGEELDIITADQTDPADFVKKGYLVDLSNEAWLKNFNPLMVEDMQKNKTLTPGKTYFVSYEGIFMGVWYNKDIFTKYNLKAPANWDEFLSVCETLKKNGVTPLVQGGKDLWPLDQELKFSREALLNDNKTFITDLATGKVKWTDKNVVDIFKRLEILNPDKGYYAQGMLGTPYDQCYQIMLQKKAAMWVMGSWATETMVKSTVKPDFELGAFALPNNAAGGQSYNLGIYAARPYGIFSGSKNIDGAKKFLEFMSQPENMSIQAEKTMVVPTVTGSTASTVPAGPDWIKIMGLPIGGTFNQDMSAGYQWGAEVQKIWWSELAKVYTKQTTIEKYCEALQAAQEKDNAKK